MTVDVGLVELDRGESRLLDGSRGWSRGCRVRGGGDRRHHASASNTSKISIWLPWVTCHVSVMH